MTSIAYVPKSHQQLCDPSKITTIYACAYDGSAVSGPSSDGKPTGPKTNHWVFYCELANPTAHGPKSIRLEPTPSGPNLSVVLLIQLKQYVTTNKAAKTFQLTLKDGITFGHLMEMIKRKGYQNYQFTPGGQGCRFWIYSVTKLLKESGQLANPAEADSGFDVLSKVWDGKGRLAPAAAQTGIQAGTFF